MAKKNAAQRRKQKAANKKVAQQNDNINSTVGSPATQSITDGTTDPHVTATQQLSEGVTPVQNTGTVGSPGQDKENTAIPIEGASDLGQVKDHETTKVVEIKDQQPILGMDGVKIEGIKEQHPILEVEDDKSEEIKEQQSTLEVEDLQTEEIKEQQPTAKVDDVKSEETNDQQLTLKVDDVKTEEIQEQQPAPKVDDVKAEETQEQLPSPKVHDVTTEEIQEQQPTPTVDGVKGQETTSRDQMPIPEVKKSQTDKTKVDQAGTLKTEQPQTPVEQHVYDQVPTSTIDNDDLKSSEKTASVENVATTNGSGMKNKSSQQGASTKRRSVFGLLKKEKVNNGTHTHKGRGSWLLGYWLIVFHYIPLLNRPQRM